VRSSIPPSFRRVTWRPDWKLVVAVTLVSLVLWSLVMLGLAAVARGAEPEEDPFVSAGVPLVWQVKHADKGVLYSATIPYAQVRRHALPNGVEGVGIAFENGFACTSTVLPGVPFTMTCGGVDEFYKLRRPESGVWQLELVKRKDSIQVPDDPPKIRS
jgi:hypothetical protein